MDCQLMFSGLEVTKHSTSVCHHAAAWHVRVLCILPCICAAAVVSCIISAEYVDQVRGLHVHDGQACSK